MWEEENVVVGISAVISAVESISEVKGDARTAVEMA